MRCHHSHRPFVLIRWVVTASWHPPPSHRTTAADETESCAVGPDGTRLFVRRRPGADGPTIILCDGIVCDGFIWKYLWDDLAQVGPVAHWHYRGHGRSASPADPDRIQVTDFAADLDEVRKHLGDPEHVVLIGHSFGVQVALEAYRRRRRGIDGLVLCCGAPGKVTETFHGTKVLAQVLPKLIAWVGSHSATVRALWSRMPKDLSVKMAYLMREVDVENMRPEDLKPYVEHIASIDPSFFFRALHAAGEHSAEDLLPDIEVPVLVIAAERDTFTPPALAKRMADAIPRGEMMVLNGGSHAALIEQPELVRTTIVQFIRERLQGSTLERPGVGAA
jgi:pimeloyl-ACP methyl ester carboxylesterase